MEVNQVPAPTPAPEKKNLKLLIYLVVVLVLAVVAVVAIYYLRGSQTTNPPPAPPAASSSAITNDSQLNDADKQLDSTDLDSLSSGLNQNDSDAASF